MSLLTRVKRLFSRPATEDASDLGFGVVPDPGLANSAWFRQWVGIYQLVDRMARARGGNLVERPLDERMIYIARGLMRYNTYAQGFISALRSHTLGANGFQHTFTGPSADKLKAYLEWWKKEVDWWNWEREIYERVHTEGGSVSRFFPDDSVVDIRPVEYDWIWPLDGSLEWTFGFYNEPDDVHNVTALNILLTGNEVVDHSEWYHIKSKMSVRADKRGRSDFLASAQLLDDSFKTWRNFTQSEAVRQSIIYFATQAEGVTSQDLAQVIAKQADYSPPVSSDGRRGGEPIRLAFGAGVEYLTAGTTLAAVPGANAQSTMTGVNAALLAVGRAYHMPLVYMSGDMGANNTLDLADESPFGMQVQDEQAWYTKHVHNLLWRVLEIAEEHGWIDAGSTTDGTKLEVQAERKPSRNATENTQRLKTLKDDGVISQRTRTTHEGFDYDEEQARIKKEPKPAPQPGMPAMESVGLVEKEITVHRGGKTFTEKRMVRPNQSVLHDDAKTHADTLNRAIEKSVHPDLVDKAKKQLAALNPHGFDEGVVVVPEAVGNWVNVENTLKGSGLKIYATRSKMANKAIKNGAKPQTLEEVPAQHDKAAFDKYDTEMSPPESTALGTWVNGNFFKQRERFTKGTLNDNDTALVSALEKAPVHEGLMYRGMINDNNSVMGPIEAAGIGGTWEDAAPGSHTRSPHIADEFSSRIEDEPGVMFSVKSKTGRAIEGSKQASKKKREQEVVSLPGTKYKIAKIEKNQVINGELVHVVHLEET